MPFTNHTSRKFIIGLLQGLAAALLVVLLAAVALRIATSNRPRISSFTVTVLGSTTIHAGEELLVLEQPKAPPGCKISYAKFYVAPGDADTHGVPIDQSVSDVAVPTDSNIKTILTTSHVRQGVHMPYYEEAWLEGCGGLSAFFATPEIVSNPTYITVLPPLPVSAVVKPKQPNGSTATDSSPAPKE